MSNLGCLARSKLFSLRILTSHSSLLPLLESPSKVRFWDVSWRWLHPFTFATCALLDSDLWAPLSRDQPALGTRSPMFMFSSEKRSSFPKSVTMLANFNIWYKQKDGSSDHRWVVVSIFILLLTCIFSFSIMSIYYLCTEQGKKCKD